MDANKPKDPMILFKSVKLGKNSKGGDHTGLSMTKEQAAIMHAEIGKLLGNERGVKLDFHISKKTAQDGSGRVFDSAICFVKPIQEFGQGYGGQRGQVQMAPSTIDEILKLKAELAALKGA